MDQPRRTKFNPRSYPPRVRQTINYGSDDGTALTSDEHRTMEEIAIRDPGLASLLAEAAGRRPKPHRHAANASRNSTTATKLHTPNIEAHEADNRYGGVEVEDDIAEDEDEPASRAENDAGYELMDRDQLEAEEDTAETEDQAETEDPQEDIEQEHAVARDSRNLDSHVHRAKLERNGISRTTEEPRAQRLHRRAPSRTPSYDQGSGDDETESGSVQDEDEESVYSEEELPTDPSIIAEISKFQATFRGIQNRFRLINKIGEGTFSSVYKAEDLEYDKFDNSWDFDNPPRRSGPRPPKYVAIKKIYVTSSPARIQNELELLHDLSGCETVVPLITAFRYQDQVVAILPYFPHIDFREYFRNLTINDIILYFKSLFSALKHVHIHDIIHRDIKPTNFLYDFYKGRGVLCDFGLAEREGTESSFCTCSQTPSERKEWLPSSQPTLSQGYPKNDQRAARRANRAGTRGFRAPEVLFKCTQQTKKIDIWSAGVILLTMLSKRFPFFNSSDDVDAIIEIATIYGKAKMRQCAALHGCLFETTIPTVSEKGFTLEKIVLWATNRASGGSSSGPSDHERLPYGEALACQFLARCMDLDPAKRISAEEALEHDFLNHHERTDEDEDEEDEDAEDQEMGL